MASKNLGQDIKERHVYYFKCGQCGRKKASSFKKSRAKAKVCRRCRKSKVNPNQMPLFVPPQELSPPTIDASS